MRSKSFGWILFLLCLLLVSLSATPYSRAANASLIIVRLAIIALVSILVIRERWNPAAKPDSGDRLLQKMRRWFHGETSSR